MSNPKISVIVPVYNAERWLQRCVDSILAQTYPDYELLLIDDGSTDNSGSICDEYASKDYRVRAFHKSNGGVSSARNIGFDKARGEWVTFCDSDDYVYPDWLTNYDLEHTGNAQLIQQGAVSDKPTFRFNGKPSCCCGFYYIGEPVEYLERLIRSSMIGYAWIKAYRIDIIRRYCLRFDNDIRFKEDEVFLFQYIVRINRVKSVDKKGYYYIVPDWNQKYVPTALMKHIYGNAMYDSLMLLAGHCNGGKILYWIYNSVIDELREAFAAMPRINIYNKIYNLVNVSYDGCNLFTPLKWIIVNDKTRLFAFTSLWVHSTLRRVLIK